MSEPDPFTVPVPSMQEIAAAREALERERALMILALREAEARTAIRQAKCRRLIPPPPTIGRIVEREFGDLLRKAPLTIQVVQARWVEAVGEKYARLSWPEAVSHGQRAGSGQSKASDGAASKTGADPGEAGKGTQAKGTQGRGGTLTLRVPGVAASLIQHAAPEILERVNRSFAKAGFTRLAIRQGPLPQRTGQGGSAPRPAPRPLTAEERAFVEADLEKIEDDGLRRVLESLGRSVVRGG